MTTLKMAARETNLYVVENKGTFTHTVTVPKGTYPETEMRLLLSIKHTYEKVVLSKSNKKFILYLVIFFLSSFNLLTNKPDILNGIKTFLPVSG